MVPLSFQISAVVVTYQRDLELARLLQSLETSALRPALVIVVDHAASPATEGLIAKFHLNTYYIASQDNPGPGAGWKRGMETALIRLPATTHFLVLDDDVVLPPEAIGKLAAASHEAAITCPMLLDSKDELWAFPEPKELVLRKKIRQCHSVADCASLLGREPLPFVWATGACVLIRRDAVEAVGFYRTDFWMLGEDLEYSMRLAAYGGGLFLPDVFVPHLPPNNPNASLADAAHRRKFDSLLQNLGYLAFHHPDSAHLRTYLPGNARRYFGTFGWNATSLRHVISCFWRGIILAQPAGASRNASRK